MRCLEANSANAISRLPNTPKSESPAKQEDISLLDKIVTKISLAVLSLVWKTPNESNEDTTAKIGILDKIILAFLPAADHKPLKEKELRELQEQLKKEHTNLCTQIDKIDERDLTQTRKTFNALYSQISKTEKALKKCEKELKKLSANNQNCALCRQLKPVASDANKEENGFFSWFLPQFTTKLQNADPSRHVKSNALESKFDKMINHKQLNESLSSYAPEPKFDKNSNPNLSLLDKMT